MIVHVAYCEQPSVSRAPFSCIHGSITGTALHPPGGWLHSSEAVEVEEWAEARALIAHSFEANICLTCGIDRQDAWGHMLPCEWETV